MQLSKTLTALPSDTPAAEMLADLLAGRFSCRAFRPAPVPTATIERMLAMAQRSASWCNSQPWQVIVTEPPATDRFREALLEHVGATGQPEQPDLPYPLGYFGVYRDRRRECGWQLYDSVGVKPGDRAASAVQARENFRLFGAPHVMIITSERDLGVYGAVDCGLYVGNLMLAAQSLGIATIAQAALARCSPFLHSYFDIPDTRTVVCGISFGYADSTHKVNSYRTSRAAVADTVTFVGD